MKLKSNIRIIFWNRPERWCYTAWEAQLLIDVKADVDKVRATDDVMPTFRAQLLIDTKADVDKAKVTEDDDIGSWDRPQSSSRTCRCACPHWPYSTLIFDSSNEIDIDAAAAAASAAAPGLNLLFLQ